MGDVNLMAVALAALAFFAVGALWYGVLFGKVWQRETGVTAVPSGSRQAVVMALTFAFEFLVCLMLGHNIARTDPSSPVIMMMAVGFGLTIMVPAIGINYLHQGKSMTLFLIDAGHLAVGMASVGAVFVLLV